MGAHPKAPSRIHVHGEWISLVDVIAQDPRAVLGPKTAAAFGDRLPFLFKVLAAETPLSIQAHPNAEQARKGFERENVKGIPLDAPQRNFKDDNPKPELLVALEPFWALCGFRTLPEIELLGNRYAPVGLEKYLRNLRQLPEHQGFKFFFHRLMTLGDLERKAVVREALSNAQAAADGDPLSKWIAILAREYPDDIGVLAPLLLNLVQLKPGEGIFLSAGILHAYLQGVGVELMANSDNVLRGGLTSKHVDCDALEEILEFKAYPVRILRPFPAGDCELRYKTPTKAFSLSRIEVGPNVSCRCMDRMGVEILLCMDGAGTLADPDARWSISFKKGDSFFVPASVSGYTLKGEAMLYKAFIPDSDGY